jgi:predicted transposase YbfD/YdcC
MDITIKNLFANIPDHRINRTKKHPLESILYIVLCGTMAGVDSWIGYQDYAEEHEEILKEFIDLPNGPPSHDTISRVISALDVDAFQSAFESFTQTLANKVKGIIAVDGKTMRGSFDRKKEVKARHIVSAWAEGCRLVLGQEKVDDKSNEITAIPDLLKRIDVSDNIITIDAMGCQREICQTIVDKGGDYVISLKGNQGKLHEDVRLFFEDQCLEIEQAWEEWDKGHGRIEHRLCKATSNTDWVQERHKWPGLKTIAAVYSSRETYKGKQEEVRYYITSLPCDAERIAKAARAHWGIENSLHWILDVTMHEDQSRTRNENAPEILNMMRKWGLNLINQHKGKLSVNRMIKKMAMSPKNLIQILSKI